MNPTLLALTVAVSTMVGADAWHATGARVRVVCPMTIGGSFDATTSALEGTLAARWDGTPSFDGSLAVDLGTLDSGIGLRNQHLREKYLQVGEGANFRTATLTALAVGGIDVRAPAGKGSFAGMLTLHGVTNPVRGTVEVRPGSSGPHVKAAFAVTLADFGIPEPRYLGIGVKDVVRIEVDLDLAR